MSNMTRKPTKIDDVFIEQVAPEFTSMLKELRASKNPSSDPNAEELQMEGLLILLEFTDGSAFAQTTGWKHFDNVEALRYQIKLLNLILQKTEAAEAR